MEYLSPSRIHTFMQCGLSFKFQYIEGIKDMDPTTDWYADYGTLFHDIAEEVAKDNTFTLEQANKKFLRNFRSLPIPDKQRDTYFEQGKQAVENTYEELKNLDIVGTEVEFEAFVDFAIPKLYGFIDLIYRDKKGRLVVRDYKTSKVYGKTKMDEQFQPIVYALACKELYGEYPYKFEFDFVRFREKKQVLINDNFIQMGIIKIKGAWNQIKNEKFEPNYSPFFCQNFCPARSICPLFLRKGGR